MGCNTLEVINGSVLTFEAIVQICDSSVFNTYPELTHFHFTDKLQEGLTIDDTISDYATAEYSSDSLNYTPFNPIEKDFKSITQLLDVQIPKDQFATLSFPLYVKVTFKAKVNDMDKLLSVKDNDGNSILENQGVFNTVKKVDGNIVQYFSKDALVNYSSLIKEYSPEVSGYSINVCPAENDGKFEAKFCLNTACDDYSQHFYILTITVPDGISFYEDKIEAYIGCCCKFNSIPIPIPLRPLNDKSKVTITINNGEIKVAQKNDTHDSCNNNISVYIPCKFENTTTTCTKAPLLITGSIKFQDATDSSSPITLAELKNFCLYVNVDCGNLVGIDKTILC